LLDSRGNIPTHFRTHISISTHANTPIPTLTFNSSPSHIGKNTSRCWPVMKREGCTLILDHHTSSAQGTTQRCLQGRLTNHDPAADLVTLAGRGPNSDFTHEPRCLQSRSTSKTTSGYACFVCGGLSCCTAAAGRGILHRGFNGRVDGGLHVHLQWRVGGRLGGCARPSGTQINALLLTGNTCGPMGRYNSGLPGCRPKSSSHNGGGFVSSVRDGVGDSSVRRRRHNSSESIVNSLEETTCRIARSSDGESSRSVCYGSCRGIGFASGRGYGSGGRCGCCLGSLSASVGARAGAPVAVHLHMLMEECTSEPVVCFSSKLVPHLHAEVDKAAKETHLHHEMDLTEMQGMRLEGLVDGMEASRARRPVPHRATRVGVSVVDV